MHGTGSYDMDSVAQPFASMFVGIGGVVWDTAFDEHITGVDKSSSPSWGIHKHQAIHFLLFASICQVLFGPNINLIQKNID
jgi:hypothetical protein